MSRSGFSECDGDEGENLAAGRWQAQVASATRGKRGQKFFRDLVAALDAMPEKKLVANELVTGEGEVCALGALAQYRKVDIAALEIGSGDPDDDWEDSDWAALVGAFDVAEQLTRETMYMNDECCSGNEVERWNRVRSWAARQIRLTNEELPETP